VKRGGFQKCLECNVAKCIACAHKEKCMTCTREFCAKCLFKCSGCNSKVCHADLVQCGICPKVFCKDCRDFIKCDRCGSGMCTPCQDAGCDMPKSQEEFTEATIAHLGMTYCKKCSLHVSAPKNCLAIDQNEFSVVLSNLLCDVTLITTVKRNLLRELDDAGREIDHLPATITTDEKLLYDNCSACPEWESTSMKLNRVTDLGPLDCCFDLTSSGYRRLASEKK
jgi:hypothetical protein